MWIARFKLKDDEDIYSPLCEKYKIEFYAYPYTNYEKNKKINLVLGGTISGSEDNKKLFMSELKKDKRVKLVEQYKDFVIVHAVHPLSREAKAEIKLFYNPEFIVIKPIKLSPDGWEYWEVACINRGSLNRLINSAVKNYHGAVFSIKQEKIKTITSFNFSPELTEKQLNSIREAYKKGYYTYPRLLTIPSLSKLAKKSYSTYQEHLRKAENKIIEFFFKYR